jgi:uncharacterized SAM-binding protein YcdF (DUF218 family)
MAAPQLRSSMLFLKDFARILAAPLLLALLAAIVSAVFRLSGRRRIAIGLLITAGGIAYFGSTSLVGDCLLGPLEQRYPPIREGESLPFVSWIVVLGSDYSPRDGISVTAAIDGDGLVRIVEGVRLAREYREIKLLVSGGARAGLATPAQGYSDLARALGVDPASIVKSDTPLDTRSEAQAIVKLLGSARFLLVTSAYHMPRAIRIMQEAGAQPIPTPTGQLVNESARGDWRRLLPSSAGLRKTEYALHEYLGFLAMNTGVN